MNRNDRRIAQTAIAIATLVLIALWLTDGAQQTTLTEQLTKDSTIQDSNYHRGTYHNYGAPETLPSSMVLPRRTTCAWSLISVSLMTISQPQRYSPKKSATRYAILQS